MQWCLVLGTCLEFGCWNLDVLLIPDPKGQHISIQVQPATWTFIRVIPALDAMVGCYGALQAESFPFEMSHSLIEQPV
jgi:hypothetical protein